jgi:hypothetical protein
MNPDYPVYVLSKGRWESRMTVTQFERMKVPYRIVVEEQEYREYAEVIKKSKILVLDKSYQASYDAFDSLGLTKSKGSGPARNFVWDHAIAQGAPFHWCVDDNIRTFFRWNKNLIVPVDDGTIFKCMEDFVGRYSNVGMAGPNYFMFTVRRSKMRPFTLNTRIYSCNLIRNDVKMRWRGRYNEDTDLSIRMLKAGWCTILFRAFIQDKMVTQHMKGGNTDEIYAKGTVDKSKMIVAMHPDICRLAWRYKRCHHYADYRKFKSLKLVRKSGLKISNQINDYGMTLYERSENQRLFPKRQSPPVSMNRDLS